MTPDTARVFEVRRDDPLHDVRVVDEALRPPAGGEVLLAVERFAVAANNLTYALLGDQLGHWASFPATSTEWGRVPAWGHAVVIDGAPGLAAPGTRWSGYLPMATHCTVRAERHGERLRAVAPERAGMLPLYRDLSPVAGPDSGDGSRSAVAVAMLPGVAAALLDELVAGTGIGRVVVSSATSKTALTSALLLSRRGIDVVGITSAAHIEAAARAGVYGTVVAYDDVDTLALSPDVVYLDVAGQPTVTAAVHARLGPSLKRSIAVGGSHRTARAQPPAVPAGPPVERFNTGDRRVHLVAEFGERAVGELEDRARSAVVAWASTHVEVPETVGIESTAAVWDGLVRGDVPPLTAPVVVPAVDRP